MPSYAFTYGQVGSGAATSPANLSLSLSSNGVSAVELLYATNIVAFQSPSTLTSTLTTITANGNILRVDTGYHGTLFAVITANASGSNYGNSSVFTCTTATPTAAQVMTANGLDSVWLDRIRKNNLNG